MKALLAEHRDHPAMKTLIDQTLAGRKRLRAGPDPAESSAGTAPTRRRAPADDARDRRQRRPFLGAMLVARNLGYLSQVHSTLNYSRKLAALGRLMAGVAHEVKNPLNAMTIHLELLKQKLEAQQAVHEGRLPKPVPARGSTCTSTSTSSRSEIRRLDEVLMGF